MDSQPRKPWEIIYIIQDTPEKKYVVAGVLLSLAIHAAGIGKPLYDAYRQARNWRQLLAIEVVDLPWTGQSPSEVVQVPLYEPLYYPPGLLGPEPGKEAEGNAREPEKPEPREVAELEGQQPEAPNGNDVSAEDATEGAPDMQSGIEQIQEGVRHARTLNIGPIRKQITTLYKAQQEGRIAIGEITVSVNFGVRDDGALTHVRLVERSGIPDVDNAALLIVDELSQLQALEPLQPTESMTLSLTIGQEIIGRITFALSSPAEAAQQVMQLNGLLAAARLLSAAQQKTQTVEFLSKIEIMQDGLNIITVARVPRTEASQVLKKQLGSG